MVSHLEKNPLISVICPTYNSSSFVLRTLESIVAQSYRPFEVIISDDGSMDDTVQTVRRFLKGYPEIQSEIIVRPHCGPGAARNAGIQHAKGEWIAFIDSDDVWLPQKLEVVAQAISKHPEVNLFCHSEEQVSRDGSRQLLDHGSRFNAQKSIDSQLYYCNLFSTSAVTCRQDLLCQSGLFDESLMSGQDYELWLRMSPWIRPYFIRDVLGYYYDRHGNISSSGDWQLWRNMIRIAVRHKDKATTIGQLYRLLRITASFGLQKVHKIGKNRRA